MPDKKSGKQKKIDWAKSMGRIEEIVDRLEKGDVDLDESIRLFEEGTDLVKNCRTALDSAELRVKKLIDDETGFREELFGEEGEE